MASKELVLILPSDVMSGSLLNLPVYLWRFPLPLQLLGRAGTSRHVHTSEWIDQLGHRAGYITPHRLIPCYLLSGFHTSHVRKHLLPTILTVQTKTKQHGIQHQCRRSVFYLFLSSSPGNAQLITHKGTNTALDLPKSVKKNTALDLPEDDVLQMKFLEPVGNRINRGHRCLLFWNERPASNMLLC